MLEKSDIVLQTEAILRQRYSFIPKNKSEEAIIGISNFLDRYIPGVIADKTFQIDLMKTIHRIFDFQFGGIAVRDPDGMYRMKISYGLTSESEKSYKQLTFSPNDLFDESNYPSTATSDITRFYMSETDPYKLNEISTYSRPQMMNQKRAAPDDMLENDYIDIYIKGNRDEILGYLELGVTRSGKLPSKSSIKWLETIAILLGLIFLDKSK